MSLSIQSALAFRQTGIAARATQYEIKWGVASAAGAAAIAQEHLARGLSLGAV